MKRLLPALLSLLLFLAGCSAAEQRELTMDFESIEAFRVLFGSDYKYAVNDEDMEFFYRHDRISNMLEIINVENRTINWYGLTDTLRYTDLADSKKVLQNGRRAYSYNDLQMVDFVDRNIYFMMQEASLTIAIADKGSNLIQTFECEKHASNLAPMLQQVIDDTIMLKQAAPDYEGDYYLTLDYHVAIVSPSAVQLAKYDTIVALQLREPVPELLSYSFANSYALSQEDLTQSKMIRDARGVNMYNNVIIYGEYYLCFSADGKAQMLYNRERDFYEWVHDD